VLGPKVPHYAAASRRWATESVRRSPPPIADDESFMLHKSAESESDVIARQRKTHSAKDTVSNTSFTLSMFLSLSIISSVFIICLSLKYNESVIVPSKSFSSNKRTVFVSSAEHFLLSYHAVVDVLSLSICVQFLIFLHFVSLQRRLPKLKSLWKQQMRAEAREKTRKDLGNMQNKVNYLKNAQLVHPSSACCSSAGDTLVRRVKRTPKEPGIKLIKSPGRYIDYTLIVF